MRRTSDTIIFKNTISCSISWLMDWRISKYTY